MSEKLEKFGIHIPEILLPGKDIDLAKWAVVACDQYTSEPEYWNEVREIAGNNPSTLHLIFPEIYLKDSEGEQRIVNINTAMEKYLREGVIVPHQPGFVLVDRKTSHSASRKGLVVAVDLERYDYSKGSTSLIRATEGTVLERIPPRVKIREKASLELPHIMILIDDPGKTVIEPLFENAEQRELLYDCDLMLDGGCIKGYKVDDAKSLDSIAAALEKLADRVEFSEKYGVSRDTGMLLFAVGDGNHSLATAKAHWENVKAAAKKDGLSKAETMELLGKHPARYALAELVNVHDDGIVFEPIHRVLFGISLQDVLDKFLAYFENEKIKGAGYKLFADKTAMNAALEALQAESDLHAIPFVSENTYGILIIRKPCFNLEVGTLQEFLDFLVKEDGTIEIDYIHGDQVVERLGRGEGCMGLYLPAMNKHDLFKTVILEGALPRKTFSMGEAEEKRYYLECRKIV